MKLALSFALISGVAAFAPTAQVRYRIGLVTHEFLRGRLLTGWHSEIDVYYGYFPRNNCAEKFDHFVIYSCKYLSPIYLFLLTSFALSHALPTYMFVHCNSTPSNNETLHQMLR